MRRAVPESGKAFPSGYFYIESPHGLPPGAWQLKVLRRGPEIAGASLTIAGKRC